MTVRNLLGMLARGIAIGVVADALRRCWVVEAWTLFPIVAGLLAWLALSTARRFRALTRRPSPPSRRQPVGDFPAQSKRPIR